MGKINCSDDLLFEKTVSSKTVFEGRVFDVEIKQILTPEGKSSEREIVKHHGGACILPIDDEGNCYLVKQFRSPFEKVMLEAPAGKIEKGEDPLCCAGTPDENEYISTVKMSLKEAVEMADSGLINDSKTLILLYKAARRFGI